MFLTWFDNIRRQPKPVRERYAFFFTLGVMAIVIGAWSFSVPNRLASIAGGNNPTSQSASAPLGGFWGQLKEQFTGHPSSILPLPPTAQNPLELLVEGVASGEIVPTAPTPVPVPATIMIATTSATANATATTTVVTPSTE